MTNIEKKIYDLVIAGKRLSITNLWAIGARSDQLKDLINRGIIKKVGLASYELISADGIYEYGELLTTQGDYYHARICFEKALFIYPCHPKANLRKFLEAITLKQYENSWKYLEALKNSGNLKSQQDYNFYLFLLNYFIDLPMELKNYVSSLCLEDILITDADTKDIDVNFQNQIRTLAYNQKFYDALGVFVNHNRKIRWHLEEVITHDLILQARKHKKKIFMDTQSAIQEQDYKKVVCILKKEERKHPLTESKKSYLMVAESIFKMTTTGNPVKEIEGTSDDAYELVCLRQYDKALKTNLRAIADKATYKQASLLNLLLKDAISIRDNLYKSNDDTSREKDSMLISIFNSLKANDITLASTLTRVYLSNLGKIEYYYLFEDNVKLSLFEREPDFSELFEILSSLSSGPLNIDIYKYIEKIEDYLSQDDIEQARLELDIVRQAIQKGHTDTPASELQDILEILDNRLKIRFYSKAKVYTKIPVAQ